MEAVLLCLEIEKDTWDVDEWTWECLNKFIDEVSEPEVEIRQGRKELELQPKKGTIRHYKKLVKIHAYNSSEPDQAVNLLISACPSPCAICPASKTTL